MLTQSVRVVGISNFNHYAGYYTQYLMINNSKVSTALTPLTPGFSDRMCATLFLLLPPSLTAGWRCERGSWESERVMGNVKGMGIGKGKE